jgi:hypothetical protein
MILDTGGFDNYQIEPLEELSCNTIQELRDYEKRIITDYRNNNDYRIMNTA